MANYANSKIYKIVPKNGDENDVYIGSTTKVNLSDRFYMHNVCYESWKRGTAGYYTVFDIFDKIGVDNCEIILIELFPCKSRQELRVQEGIHIRALKCVNKMIAGRSSKEYKHTYHIDNIEKIHKKKKEKYDENRDQHIIKAQKYYKENKADVQIWKATKIMCLCGKEYTQSNKARHFKSQDHQKIINK